jgi:hypothetical protein
VGKGCQTRKTQMTGFRNQDNRAEKLRGNFSVVRKGPTDWYKLTGQMKQLIELRCQLSNDWLSNVNIECTMYPAGSAYLSEVVELDPHVPRASAGQAARKLSLKTFGAPHPPQVHQ